MPGLVRDCELERSRMSIGASRDAYNVVLRGLRVTSDSMK